MTRVRGERVAVVFSAADFARLEAAAAASGLPVAAYVRAAALAGMRDASSCLVVPRNASEASVMPRNASEARAALSSSGSSPISDLQSSEADPDPERAPAREEQPSCQVAPPVALSVEVSAPAERPLARLLGLADAAEDDPRFGARAPEPTAAAADPPLSPPPSQLAPSVPHPSPSERFAIEAASAEPPPAPPDDAAAVLLDVARLEEPLGLLAAELRVALSAMRPQARPMSLAAWRACLLRLSPFPAATLRTALERFRERLAAGQVRPARDWRAPANYLAAIAEGVGVLPFPSPASRGAPPGRTRGPAHAGPHREVLVPPWMRDEPLSDAGGAS